MTSDMTLNPPAGNRPPEAPSAAPGTRYLVDPGVSRLTIRVSAGGMLSGLGHSPTFAARDYTGEIRFDPDASGEASVQLIIKAGSLALVDEVSEKDRREIERTMHQEVLGSSAHPEIVYRGSDVSVSPSGNGWYAVRISGTLTLRGGTRPQPVSARVAVTGDTLRASGEFTLRQSDYGIRPYTGAGGLLKVKDELKGAFDILARR
jgi:polyisoprenoid-binding protein YceI